MTMNRVLRSVLMFTLSLSLALGLWAGMPAGKVVAATCTSQADGDWNNVNTWDCAKVPGATDDVNIGHQITLTQNESVNDITINSAADRLIGAYTLEVYGTLSASSTSPNANIISSSTLVKFVGPTDRALFGTWGATTTGLVFEVALDANTTGSGTNVKARSITITSGTLYLSGELRPDAGSENTGMLSIASGATLRATRLSRTGTANIPFESFTNYGTFKTSSGTIVWPNDTPCVFGADSTVEYIGSSQTIQTPLNSSYGHLVLSGGGTKTAPANLEIRGDFTNSSTFGAGVGTVTFSGTTEQIISGTSTTAFNNLTVNSGATVVIPSTNIPTIASTMVNSGTLKQTQTVNNATVNFLTISTDKYRGVDIETPNDLGVVTVTVQGNADACTSNPASPAYIKRCFSITPSNQATATLTLWATDAEMNGIDFLSGDEGALYRYVTNQWVEQDRVEFGADSGYNYVIADVDGFSSFLFGKSGDTPTAVTYAGLTSSASLWAPFSLLFLGGAAVVLRKRR